MITEVSEPISRVQDGIVMVHCNCAQMMASGTAKTFREMYKEVFPAYKESCQAFDDREELMGKFRTVQVKKRLWICLCFAQLNVAKFSFNTRPEAYQKIFRTVKSQLRSHFAKTGDKAWTIHLDSKLGNEGGTDFNVDIYPLLTEAFGDSEIQVVIHKA